MTTNKPEVEAAIDQRPDWLHWRCMEAVCLWQAVPLSFNVEPSYELIGKVEYSNYRAWGFLNDKMQKLLVVVLSNIEAGKLRPLSSVLHYPLERFWMEIKVPVSEFGSWALNLRIGIPDDFPRGTGTVAVRTGAKSRAFEIPHASTKLLKALALLESFGGNLEDFPSSTDLKKLIRKHCYPDAETESLSTEATIAAFLRPDALRDPDGRAGKSKIRE
jgi:hypothetical protein